MIVVSIKYLEKNLKAVFDMAKYGDITLIHTSHDRTYFILYMGPDGRHHSILNDMLKTERGDLKTFPYVKTVRELRQKITYYLELIDKRSAIYVTRGKQMNYAIIKADIVSRHEKEILNLQQQLRCWRPIQKQK
ncbi:MAG: hypothetical protein LBR10_09900 [Prevotellaceae bacterium]|jgi:uncharacterized protein YlbG (UPF0298 family)|nr:hypothetical protein [Prevotellaceae bacterium]